MTDNILEASMRERGREKGAQKETSIQSSRWINNNWYVARDCKDLTSGSGERQKVERVCVWNNKKNESEFNQWPSNKLCNDATLTSSL